MFFVVCLDSFVSPWPVVAGVCFVGCSPLVRCRRCFVVSSLYLFVSPWPVVAGACFVGCSPLARCRRCFFFVDLLDLFVSTWPVVAGACFVGWFVLFVRPWSGAAGVFCWLVGVLR